MSQDQQEEKGGQSPGALSLMGLFSPPTPPTAQDDRKLPSDTTKEASVSSSGSSQKDQPKPVAMGSPVFRDRKLEQLFGVPPSPEKSAKVESASLAQEHDQLQFNHERNETTPLLPQASPGLQGLFDGPPPPSDATPSSPLRNLFQKDDNEHQRTGSNYSYQFTSPNDFTPKLQNSNRKNQRKQKSAATFADGGDLLWKTMPPIHEVPIKEGSGFDAKQKRTIPITETFFDVNAWRQTGQKAKKAFFYCCSQLTEPTTWIGTFMFLLFHTVFCLTMGAAITRPHASTSIVGLMTKMSALGVIITSPAYWYLVGLEIPSLYPTQDLFPAPFLANIAILVDKELYDDPNVTDENNDQYFLGTFSFLASLSLLISGTLMMLASVFKLANLGSYLPFPVLCGFFAAVGVLTWTLAFKVDTNGKTVHDVFFSGNWDLIERSIIHHAPSLILGGIMKYFGPKNPFYVVGIVCATIAIFYTIIFVFGFSMAEMVEDEWFWGSADLHYEPVYKVERIGFSEWRTPAPCGWINSMFQGRIHWKAVGAGLDTTIALSFLYLIRCSLHGAALKKNVPNLSQYKAAEKEGDEQSHAELATSSRIGSQTRHKRKFSEAVDVENVNLLAEPIVPAEDNDNKKPTRVMVHAKPTNAKLKDILQSYGINQLLGGLIGSFGILPSVAAAPTMYTIGAEKIAPQLGAVLMLSVFYLTDFNLVGLIPKTAFSSMLVLAAIDMVYTWGIKSYFKTREKPEWFVVPLIVIMAFVVGLLQAVFLGIAMSTFLFVASFFRSGVVKYVANGLNIRSTIERPMKVARWLDETADQIQILVLQNYLFFGNASSILSYVTSMFDEPHEDVDPIFVPPKPKIVILDLTLVTGMDTSAVDVFAEILNQCTNHDCKLFLSGVSNPLRQVMSLSGFKPESSVERSKRKLRFFNELDAAIGKAEDMLIDFETFDEDFDQWGITTNSGFRAALNHIEQEQKTDLAADLIKLESFTKVVDIQPGEVLYQDQDFDRGLFFIEYGIMKIERNSDFTFSRGVGNEAFNQFASSGTLNAIKSRSTTIGKQMARFKNSGLEATASAHNSRVARVGPGWILGSIEALSGSIHSGRTVAVTKCRLHFISYGKITEIEKSNPVLILKLYKLLSFLMAKRQENTIAQLGTLQSIMSAPARKQPTSRGAGFAQGGFVDQ